jgi:hypothetical protein
MIGVKPQFLFSPFFVPELDNWHLLPGAPQAVIDEFTAFMGEETQPEAPPPLTAKDLGL